MSITMASAELQSAPVPASAVQAQVNRLEGAASRLSSAIAELEDRMRPVLVRHEVGEACIDAPRAPLNVPLAEELESLANHFDSQASAIHVLIGRLGI